MFRKKTIGFISDIDKFQIDFDKTHEKSASQLAEIQRDKIISNLRDVAKSDKETDKIWEEF